MSKSVSASSSENSPPTSFEQFNELVKGIESLYVLGRRLSDAVARQPCAFADSLGSPSAFGDYFRDWFKRVDETRAVQPHWKPPRMLRAMSAVYGAENLSLVLAPESMSCINR